VKPLPDTFRKGGYDYQRVARDGDVAIYAQSQGERIYAHEVVIVQRYPDYEMMGKLIAAHEAFPSTESWGSQGWTCTSLTEACRKMSDVQAMLAAKADAKALEAAQ
jgi:hypothetical protein